MKKLVWTLVLAVLMLGFGIAVSRADERCSSGTTHSDKIVSDIATLAMEPGWETTKVSIVSGNAAIRLIELFFAMPDVTVRQVTKDRVTSQGRHILWIRTDGKPNAYVVFLDKDSCWMADAPVPIKRWERMVRSVEQGL